MLNVMRENLKHLKWVLWIVAISMVLYLGVYFTGNSRRGGADADWAAKVDGTPIPTRQFLEVARRADEYYRKMLGAQYDQVRPQLQLGRQVIQQLVDERVVLAEARKLGLGASSSEVSRQILADAQFHDANGRFVGRDRYTAVMERMWPGGVAAYERKVADDISMAKWRELVTEPIEISDAEILDLYRSRSDRAAVDYVVVPATKQQLPTIVSDADVRTWYDAHKESYRRGEGRRIRYVVVERQAQIPKVKVSDDDVKSFYEANRAQYDRPEQRRARHVLFRVEKDATPEAKEQVRQQAEAALARLRGGEDFAALARTLSQDKASAEKGGDLGFFGRGQMVPPFDKAAFETPVGQFAPLVETEFGFHVIQVTEARPAGVAPLETLRDGIRRQIEYQRAQQIAQSEAQRIRAAIASANDLDAVAAKESLKIQEAVASREEMPRDLGPSPEFADSVFRLAPGSVSQPLGVAKGLAIVASLGTVPPTVPPLAEIQDRVRTEVLNSRERDSALAEARRALASHPDLASAAKALGEQVRSSGDLTPGRSLPGAGRAPELDKAVFGPGTKVGDRGVVAAAAGAVIYTVTRRETFAPSAFESSKPELRAELLAQRRAAALQSILQGVRQKHKVEINEELVNSLKA
jgi:peptidyl-prolyl cis-trans isomerase D